MSCEANVSFRRPVANDMNACQFRRCATDRKNGNAGPKLHWILWEEMGFLPLPS